MTPDRAGPAHQGAVLFDIDGTLVDSNYLHVHAWTRAFLDGGHPVDAAQVHRGMGMGSELLLPELLGEDVAQESGADLKERHSAVYAELAPLLRVFDGAQELVREVGRRGARTVLATSASAGELERLRAVLGLDDVVDGVASAKDVEDAKPAPDLSESALELAGVPAERAVMVGDAVWDVIAAQRAGVACVGVLTGGTSEAELLEAGAVAVYRDVATLLAELDASPLAATWADAG